MRLTTHRRLDQEEVLIAAVDVAFELGLYAVTSANVAARIGVPERSVSAAWPDADALVATTFGRIAAADLAEMKRHVLAHPSPTDQLAALLEAIAEEGDIDAVWLESWSLGRRNRALGDVVRSEEGAWHAFVAAVIRRGVKTGDHPGVDAEDVAAHLLAVVEGVNAYSLVGYRTELDRLRLLHAVARTHLGTSFGESEPSSLSAV